MDFRNKVLKLVARIPSGQMKTYKEIARLAGRPRAYGAVGNILNKNKNTRIPCHRVIRSDGLIGGYNKGINKKNFF